MTPEQAQSLADELARAAEASLFHPSIVEPVAAGVQGTVAYRAEEYVAAESLDVAMRHYAPAALSKALPFITQLAGAIDFARAAGIGHGALHPRDIFVTPDEARATGFGVVEALERVGLRAPVRRPYTAPERIAGVRWTTSADVFSLAAIAFELLTGRRPSGTGPQIGSLNGTDLGNAGPAIHGVLARAMDDRPDHRYQGALEFAAALEAASRGEHPTGAATEVAAVTGILRDEARPVEAKTAAAVEKPAAAAPADEDEDIAAERDEDEAHGALLEEEVAAAAARDDESLLSLDDPEAEADRFIDEPELADMPLIRDQGASAEAETAAAAAALPAVGRADPIGVASRPSLLDSTESAAAPRPSLLDSTESSAPPRVSLLETTEAEAPYGKRPSGYPSIFDSTDAATAAVAAADDHRSHTRVLPYVMTAVFCLLIGFAAGYGVANRDWRLSTSSTDSQKPESKPFSEQAVEPPPAAAPKPAAAPPPASQPPRAAPNPQPDTAPAASAPAAVAPRPTAPRATAGRIEVRSTPTGAGVTINGRWRGRTPLILEKQRFARYSVRVVQPGYVAAQENLTLSAADPEGKVSVRLQRQPAAATTGRTERPAPEPREETPLIGSLFIDSRPRGARVFLDDRPVGTTPLSIPNVPIGSHVVRFELAEHRPWSSTTRVVAGQIARVTGSMERIQ